MYLRRLLGAFLVSIGLTSGAQAANILVFEDLVLGTSAIPGALTLSGLCGTCTTTTDPTTFNTALTGSTWDLVIYAEQNTSTFGASSAELTAYVSGGGRIIGQTWLTGGLDALLEASSASTNGTSITTNANPVFAGLGPSISLTDTGWGIFSQGWTPAGSAVGLGSLNSGGFAVILGNSGRSFMNAPLTDTYTTLSEGERLLANEIGLLLQAQVPEPATLALLGLALAGLGFARRRRLH